ncbi:MAG: hypothetical protein NZ777_19735, partial [Pseudomonadales bacterium]|nr:hypothetical protein [Pseudomonadales bacterium]
MSEALQSDLRADPMGMEINDIDLMQPTLFHGDYHLKLFERLRQEDPVYFQKVTEIGNNGEELGRIWHVTRYRDIMAVDTNPQVFSSAGSIVADDQDDDFPLPMFIAMDP